FLGAALDTNGKLVALAPGAGTLSIPVAAAAHWSKDKNAAIALEAFLRNLGPGSPSARLRLARSLLKEQRFADAARAFLQVPSDGKLRVTAGQIQMQLKRFLEAEPLFREAASLDATVAGEALSLAQKARDLAGGPGAVVLDFDPGVADIIVNARLNATVGVRL